MVDHLWTSILPCDARNDVSAETIAADLSDETTTAKAPGGAPAFHRVPRSVRATPPSVDNYTEAQFYDLHGCTFDQYVSAASSALLSAGTPRLPEAADSSVLKRVGNGRLYWFTFHKHTCCHGNVHEEDNFTTRLVQGAVQRACYATECLIPVPGSHRQVLDWRTICYVTKNSSSGLQPAFRREFGASLSALGFALASISDAEPVPSTAGRAASRFTYSAPCAMCRASCAHSGAFFTSIATDGLVTVHPPRGACSSPSMCAVGDGRPTPLPPTDFALYRPLLEAVLGVSSLDVVETAVCKLINWKGISSKRRRDPVPSRFLRYWKVSYRRQAGDSERTKHFHLADDGSLWESFAPETQAELHCLDFSTESPGPDSQIGAAAFQQLSSWFDRAWASEFARLGVVKRSACDYDMNALLLNGVLPWVHLKRMHEFCCN